MRERTTEDTEEHRGSQRSTEVHREKQRRRIGGETSIFSAFLCASLYD
jgi:hypothetical protein